MKTLFNVFSAVSPNEKNLKKLWKSNENSDWKTNIQRIRCCALPLYPLKKLSRKGAKAKKNRCFTKNLQKNRLIELLTMFSVITRTKKMKERYKSFVNSNWKQKHLKKSKYCGLASQFLKRSSTGLKAKNMAENGNNAFILAFHQPS